MKRFFFFLFLCVSLPIGIFAQDESRAIQFPDAAGYQVLKVDLHQQTVFSDGDVWPSVRVEEGVKDSLDAITITDHLEYQPHSEDVPNPDRGRAYQIAQETGQEHNLIVINGAEITRDLPPGHCNAIFLNDVNRLLKDDPMDVFQAAKEQGAFVFWNHPMYLPHTGDGIAKITDMHRELISKDMLHGIEVATSHRWSPEAVQIALDNGLTMVGNSDVHGLIDWDYEPHKGGHRPITLAFAEERSKQGIKKALFAGRTAVWYQNLLIGREEYVVPLINESLTVTETSYRRNSSVLRIEIANNSDAEYLLDSQNEISFHVHSDVIQLSPHTTTEIQVKPGERVESLNLQFEVLNAVIAPETHPSITLDVEVDQ